MSSEYNHLQEHESVLFITYDGLLDPLGGSQILPYLHSISSHPRRLHIISFEKQARYKVGGAQLRLDLAKRGIGWTPLSFSSRAGKLGKAWDLMRMYAMALRLQLRYRFSIAHCRSYQAMQVGCCLRRVTRIKTIFDMRGLWVDDRVEGGLWSQDKWTNRWLYRHYKQIERTLLTCANQVVVLTDKVVPEIKRLAPDMTAPITVIPCCADFDLFIPLSNEGRLAMRNKLGIPPGALVLSYLGSLGTVYLLHDALRLYASLSRQYSNLHMLFITQDWRDEHELLLKAMGLDRLRESIHVRAADRDQVPRLLCTSDIMVSFRRPTYSQMACSPTKLAEAFALGIPAISNSGVGDVDQIICDLDAGALVDLNDPHAFDRLASELEQILLKRGTGLRMRARERFGLEVAKRCYRRVYAALESES